MRERKATVSKNTVAFGYSPINIIVQSLFACSSVGIFSSALRYAEAYFRINVRRVIYILPYFSAGSIKKFYRMYRKVA